MATRKNSKVTGPRISEETASWILADEEDKLQKEDLAEKYTTSIRKLINKATKDNIKLVVPFANKTERAYFDVDYRTRRDQFIFKFGPRPDTKTDD